MMGCRAISTVSAAGTRPRSSSTSAANSRSTPRRASRLRIDFRQFVGDVEWLACAESSSGWRRFDGEIIDERLHIDTDSFVVAVDVGQCAGLRPMRGLRTRRGSGR